MMHLCLLVVFSKFILTSSNIPDPGFGVYKALKAQVTIGDLTQGGSQDAILWYPESTVTKPTFPFVAFAHGYGCGGNNLDKDYSQLMATIASHGFIVVAPMSCPDSWCDNYYQDIIITVQTCRNKTTQIHECMKQANFAKVGLVGHSMGAMSVVLAGGYADEINAVATVSLHPCFTKADPSAAEVNTVPTMFWTGTKDTTCPSWEAEEAYSKYTKKTPRTYANIVGADHLECFTYHPNREDPYAIQFLQCLTLNNQTSCQIIQDKNTKYGLCTNGNYTYDGCYVTP